MPLMISLFRKGSVLAGDIKLAHSIFALPFALLAAFLAPGIGTAPAPGIAPGQLLLIVLCMFFARTYAMLTNRLLDRSFDAANPRTAGRALPAGRVKPRDVIFVILLCAIGLIACAAAFGPLYQNYYPLLASPLVLLWLGAYAVAKRFTPLAHFILGGALGLSPLAAGLAVQPASLASPPLWLLAGFVLLWVGGFDIIYALQDIEHDQREGLHSIPARLGRGKSLLTAKFVHLLALLLLVLVMRTSPALRTPHIPGTDMSWFSLGVVLVAALLLIEHRAAQRNRFTLAFFTLNGLIALLLAAAGVADVLLMM
ncbi:MAG: UbiA-like polyprenyltransferase [Phycisphaeraceae bacterium]